MDPQETDRRLRDLYAENAAPVDMERFSASLHERLATVRGRPWWMAVRARLLAAWTDEGLTHSKRRSTPRQTSIRRIAVYACMAVVLVAAIAVGSLEAVKHLGRDQPVLVITDDTTGIPPGSTSETTQTTASEATTTPATVWEAGDGTWQPVMVAIDGAPIRDLVVDPSNPSVLYATTDQGLFKSTDSAAHWVQLFSEVALLVAVDPVSSSTLYAIAADWEGLRGEEWVMLRSDDGGASWQVVDDASPYHPHRPQGFVFDATTSPSTVYYYGPGLRRSTDRGQTWTDLISEDTPPEGADDPDLRLDPVEAVALDPIHAGIIYVVSHYEAVLLARSTDGGATWEKLPSGLIGQPFDDPSLGVTVRLGVDPGDASRLYQGVLGLGPAGEERADVVDWDFAQSTDQGETWTLLEGAAAEQARAVLEAGPGVSAESIDALLALTGGAELPMPKWMRPWDLYAGTAATADPPALYAFGNSGVFKSTDAGATWSSASSGLGYAWVYEITVDPASVSTLYACTDQGIGKSTDGGRTWDKIYAGTADQLLVAPSASSVLYAVAGEGLLRSDDGGATWYKRTSAGLTLEPLPHLPTFAGWPTALAMVAADSPDTIYAYNLEGSGEDSLYRSADGGDSWEPCATGEATVLRSLVSAPSDPSILYATGTLSPGDVWNSVEESTGLVTSTDGGETWSFQEAPAGIRVIAVDAEEPSTLYILSGEYDAWVGVLVEGTLYRSTDAGGTWQEIEFEHLGDLQWISADPRLPGVIYAATVLAGLPEAYIYRSLDGGATWDRICDTLATGSFAADLVADEPSEIAFYALQLWGGGLGLCAYQLSKWVPGDE